MPIMKAKFVHEKSTKRTERYQERAEGGQPPIMGLVYIQRWVLGSPIPKEITITVEY